MAIQTINIGTTANDGTGDDPRTAGSKINDNFTNSTHAASRDVGTSAGNVMEVGAFGLGDALPNIAGGFADFDEASGFYRHYSPADRPASMGGGWVLTNVIKEGGKGSAIQSARYITGLSGTTVSPDVYVGGKTPEGALLPWAKIHTTLNTTVDGSGFIKEASPIVKLYSDKIEPNDYKELESCEFERVDTGHYIIKGAPLLSRDGWYIETLKDRNNNIYFTLDYEELEDGLHIKTYEPDYSTGRATNGAPVDINEGRFVTLRFEEDKTEE